MASIRIIPERQVPNPLEKVVWFLAEPDGDDEGACYIGDVKAIARVQNANGYVRFHSHDFAQLYEHFANTNDYLHFNLQKSGHKPGHIYIIVFL
jgi:hypothetical protein